MNFKKPVRGVKEIFVHHSASARPEDDDISVMRKWHLERGYQDVGYHYFITSGGVIQPGRNLELIPAAQGGHNTGTIAICLSGVGSAFSDAQFDALRVLCKEINKAYAGAVTFHGHKEVYATECPHYDYKKILKLDATGKLGI